MIILRYKVWDKKNKEMIMGVDFVNEEVLLRIPKENNEFEFIWKNLKYFDLIEYTELNDDSDNPIYQNDILEGYSVYPEADVFKSFYKGVVFYNEENKTWYCGQYKLSQVNYQMKVIGNTIENPELI